MFGHEDNVCPLSIKPTVVNKAKHKNVLIDNEGFQEVVKRSREVLMLGFKNMLRLLRELIITRTIQRWNMGKTCHVCEKWPTQVVNLKMVNGLEHLKGLPKVTKWLMVSNVSKENDVVKGDEITNANDVDDLKAIEGETGTFIWRIINFKLMGQALPSPGHNVLNG